MAPQHQQLPQARPDSSAGAAIYTPWFLKIYDFLLLRLANPLIWNFPAEQELIPLLKSALIGSRHLDIGVGTGFYPAKALASTDRSACEHMTLVDLNPNALTLAARTIRTASRGEISVTTIQADILAPPLPPSVGGNYDSISLFYLIHCLPGPSDAKIRAVADAVAPLLAAGGTVVGATILGRGKRLGWFPTLFRLLLNWLGVFGNLGDEEEVLVGGLRRRFREVVVWQVGAVMMFRARGAKSDGDL
ncbi:hypothetical protein CDD80_4577 [Ophiocordyceps camponoti-rufipedis]|uniref:Methyltransferase type 12 domain-containing protein n=1 Tax=Ophiocordyceps camponoti-rufipedis TaxID=2004952 RepID=A0A2C5YUC1_9HYPO|nr:hypothetical protein CDD80_4577 [Ophiocordyceps camponoti-rufipedis]